MKIEVGKFYRTRDGRKVGPVVMWSESNVWHPFEVTYEPDDYDLRDGLWSTEGECDEGSQADLIAECQDEEVNPLEVKSKTPTDAWHTKTGYALKVGTKIKVTDTRYPSSVPNGSIMTVTNHVFGGVVDATVDGGCGYGWCMEAGTYKVLEDDTQDTPIPFGGLTDLEQAALLLAHQRGKAIECYQRPNYGWVEGDWDFDDVSAYRIAPEPPKPVVETMYVYLKVNKNGKLIGSESLYTMTHYITFDTIDGVPDAGSIKMAPVT
jgi:hypothetical protein